MRNLVFCIFGLYILVSCHQPQGDNALTTSQSASSPTSSPNIPETSDKYRNITIVTKGPRGGGYYDSTGKIYGYRIFRVDIKNDNSNPVELTAKFPAVPIKLLPDSNKYLRVFLFPEVLTPRTMQDTYGFGVTGIESFLDTGLTKSIMLKKIIQSEGHHVLYVGILFNADGLDGLARAKFFVRGHDPDVSFIPVKSQGVEALTKDKIDLIFGIGIDPPLHYSLVPCAQIVIRE